MIESKGDFREFTSGWNALAAIMEIKKRGFLPGYDRLFRSYERGLLEIKAGAVITLGESKERAEEVRKGSELTSEETQQLAKIMDLRGKKKQCHYLSPDELSFLERIELSEAFVSAEFRLNQAFGEALPEVYGVWKEFNQKEKIFIKS